MLRITILFSLFASSCAISTHQVVPASVPTPQRSPILADLALPGPISHTAVVSARWSVPLAGLLDLDDPEAHAAWSNVDTPIVLPVHVLSHPVHGAWVIDTGIPRQLQEGRLPVSAPVRSFLRGIEPVRSLASIGEEHGLDGVLITHLHLDHILGLLDVPPATPVFVGQGEVGPRSVQHAFVQSSVDALISDRPPLRAWPFTTEGVRLGAIEHAIDVFGDGTLWALHVPGHTAGSTAFLARTTEGPMLFTGDCSHTIWGWEHGVTPGTYTSDHAENGRSLDALRALAEATGARVFVGHELDGRGTGPDDSAR